MKVCAIAPLRIHSVSSGECLALMLAEESSRRLSLWVFDRRERLFDELSARDFSAGEKLRKLADRARKAHWITSSTRAASRGPLRSVAMRSEYQMACSAEVIAARNFAP